MMARVLRLPSTPATPPVPSSTAAQAHSSASSPPAIINIAAYKFVPLQRLPDRRQALKKTCQELELKGTILLSPEGMNLFLAGTRQSVDEFLSQLREEACFADVTVKESVSEHQPFNRLLVRLKQEIIAFGVEGIDPSQYSSPKISPAELKAWLDEGRPVTLLDTRNDYEVDLGTFAGALDLKIGHFREFPQAVKSLPASLKEQPVVMFCTGGIRCEKAGPLMEREGFQNVLQLDGGILRYFEDCGGDHWNGECFVFDQRVSLDPKLCETETAQCFACQASLTPEDRQSVKYVLGKSCPSCFRPPHEEMQVTIRARHQRIRELTSPLPGSVPYDNERPLNVPRRFDGFTLLDFLDSFHPHVGRAIWRHKCDLGQVVYQGAPVGFDKQVRAGERYVHLLPDTVEPEVRADIEILYEDEALVVVNKPAPLPMHASGRFNRNTLSYILNEAYRPQKLRHAHRLDANTSGVVVLSRKKSIAALLQRQFKEREVVKTYVARVHGSPASGEFFRDTRIGEAASKMGIRLPDANGQEARTEFRVLEHFGDGTTLIEARPITGRTNQIRLHLWDAGLPVCGDPSYLPNKEIGHTQTLQPNDPPLCLHSLSISLRHPTSNVAISFTTPRPSWAKD